MNHFKLLKENDKDIEIVENQLLNHHKAKIDNTTQYRRAIQEYNIYAIGKLYSSISYEHLASLLNVKDIDSLEYMVFKMISSGRLEGYLDQVGKYLFFKSSKHVINEFDSEITKICQKVNDLYEYMQVSA